jgi:MFS family permease
MSLIFLGASLGAFLNGLLQERLGRRITILFSDLVLIFGHLILWSTLDLRYLLFGRFFTGIGLGGNYVSAITYMYESGPI